MADDRRADPIWLLYVLYFVPCEIMYQHHLRLKPHFLSGDDKTREAAGQEFFAFTNFWFASLYVVAEGWRELKVPAPEITQIIEKHIDSLRLFRNAVYHFQRGDQKHAQFFDVDKFNWAQNIHVALRLYFAAKGWFQG
jgi:hypothetical protein